MTGKNPGKHGIFSFRHPAAAGYATGKLITANSLKARTLWQIVGEAGLPVGAINVPPSYPVRPINGFMVACMFAPPGERAIVYPPELRAVLGDDYEITVAPPGQLRTTDPDYRERCLDYLNRLRRQAQRRLEITQRLMAECPWALLSVVFYEPDRIQHFFWHYLAGAGPPGVDHTLIEELAREARAAYRQLDEAVGELVRAAGPETITLIVSDHGFGAAPDRFVYVNRWLIEGGWLRPYATWRWRRRLVKQLPRRLRARHKAVEKVLIDFSRSSAWCEVMDVRSAGVWLNVRGRQPLGSITPGREYDTARDKLIRALADVHEDGDRVFDLVAPREAVYKGPMTAFAPDILLSTNPRHGLSFSLRGDVAASSVFAPFDWSGYTGTHDPAGVYIVSGPGIAPLGRRVPAQIEAVAPTILCLLGLPIPDDMDAAPLLDVLTPELRASSTVQYMADRAADATEGGGWLSEDDQSQVEERLRALGYLE